MPESPRQAPSALGILLGGIAGAVDAIGYVLLAHVFTAHMTGNTVALGVALGSAHWAEAARRAVPVGFFLAGGLLGAFVARIAWRMSVRHALAALLAVEGLLLLALLAAVAVTPVPPSPPRFLLITALAASAMGAQNLSFRHYGCPSANTTVITGALSDISEQLMALSLWGAAWLRRVPKREVLERSRREPSQLHATFSAGLWTAYFFGAVFGGGLEIRLGWPAVLLPVGGLAIAFGMAMRHPSGRC